ncbi:hypothetical protein JTB14_001886 [Gonioctena quinquepunctata]|nr:hypothetical protein JTB14_001886 [Gonioctena quinquepunctata]
MNLQKENTERKGDEEVTCRKFKKSYAISIEQYLREIDEHLKSRIGEFYDKSITISSKVKVITRPCSDSTDSDFTSETGNMTEKMDLRTAASLLPVMNAVSFQMHNSKQRNCSIDDFGKSTEELLVDLTITQAEGNQNAIQVLRGVNEKIAINAFANGLQNSELRTITESRNYSKLSDAIQGSEDEEIPEQNAKIFHMEGRKNFRHNTGNNRFFRNSHVSQQNRVNFSGNRGQNSSRNIRRGYNFRGYRGNTVRNNPQKAYYSRNSNENIPIINHETVSHNSPLPSTSSEPSFGVQIEYRK